MHALILNPRTVISSSLSLAMTNMPHARWFQPRFDIRPSLYPTTGSACILEVSLFGRVHHWGTRGPPVVLKQAKQRVPGQAEMLRHGPALVQCCSTTYVVQGLFYVQTPKSMIMDH